MEDVKRGTGRTTRMILKAVEYLMRYPDKTVTIVVHDMRFIAYVTQLMLRTFHTDIVDRVKFITYTKWKTFNLTGSTRRDDIFFDHHCFYSELTELYKARDQLNAEILRQEKNFGEYNA